MLSYDVGMNRTIRLNICTQWNDNCKSNKYFYAWQKGLYQLLMTASFVSRDLMLLLGKMILVKY